MRSRWAASVLAALLLLTACNGGTDEPPDEPTADATPSPTPQPDPTCPLSGRRPTSEKVLERPAVAVKVENNPVAYPLAGIDKAEIVFEEQVEGGMTRFMAIFHCTDAPKVGPVRSSRTVDPAIMSPITRILVAAGGNETVRRFLRKDRIFLIDEDNAGAAMRRIPRSGVSFEHTLFGNTTKLRKLGQTRFKKTPAQLFEFGDATGGGRRVKRVTLQFGSATTIEWVWSKKGWKRFERGSPFMTEAGQVLVDNLVIEEHVVNNSRTIFDVAGNPSIEIADETGKGRAILFRDGRAYIGKWMRKKRTSPVEYVGRGGDPLVFAKGTTWIELLPNRKGEVKGSVAFKR